MARVLFLGQLFEGSTALGRVRALQSLGHEVQVVEAFPPERGLIRLLRAARRRHGLGPSHPVNRALLRAIDESAPEVLWVEKGIHVTAPALAAVRRKLPGAVLIHYTCDRTAVPGNVSWDLLRALPSYDLAVTTVQGEVVTLADLGARRVIRTWHGYDPELFHPPLSNALDPTLAGRILFVGAWEAERSATITALADAGLPVTIVSHWREWAAVASRPGDIEWRREAVFGPRYPVLLASGAVALGFLRKLSQDEHTQRSFEIPASGGVLVAERTSEHLELFEDGREAEFFSTDEECVEKCRALLADERRRRAMAEAGRQRCAVGGYSWSDRLRSVLAEVAL